MQWLGITSVNIRCVAYTPANGDLYVVFNNSPGWRYVYRKVPIGEFVNLVTSISVGQYFHKHIRNKFEFIKQVHSDDDFDDDDI